MSLVSLFWKIISCTYLNLCPYSCFLGLELDSHKSCHYKLTTELNNLIWDINIVGLFYFLFFSFLFFQILSFVIYIQVLNFSIFSSLWQCLTIFFRWNWMHTCSIWHFIILKNYWAKGIAITLPLHARDIIWMLFVLCTHLLFAYVKENCKIKINYSLQWYKLWMIVRLKKFLIVHGEFHMYFSVKLEANIL